MKQKELYYSPIQKKFTTNEGAELSLEEAKAFFIEHQPDYNIALQTVIDHDWDMAKVDEYYSLD